MLERRVVLVRLVSGLLWPRGFGPGVKVDKVDVDTLLVVGLAEAVHDDALVKVYLCALGAAVVGRVCLVEDVERDAAVVEADDVGRELLAHDAIEQVVDDVLGPLGALGAAHVGEACVHGLDGQLGEALVQELHVLERDERVAAVVDELDARLLALQVHAGDARPVPVVVRRIDGRAQPAHLHVLDGHVVGARADAAVADLQLVHELVQLGHVVAELHLNVARIVHVGHDDRVGARRGHALQQHARVQHLVVQHVVLDELRLILAQVFDALRFLFVCVFV